MTQTIDSQLRNRETGQLPARGSRVRITDQAGASTEAEIKTYMGRHPGFMTWVVFEDATGTETRSLQDVGFEVEVLDRAGDLSFEHDTLGLLGRLVS